MGRYYRSTDVYPGVIDSQQDNQHQHKCFGAKSNSFLSEVNYWRGDGHIPIHHDKTTAVHFIDNMGTRLSFDCLGIVLEIWEWAKAHGNWLTATHMENVEGDVDLGKSTLPMNGN